MFDALKAIDEVIYLSISGRDDEMWDIIRRFNKEKSKAVFERCLELSQSDNFYKQRAAANILGTLGCYGGEYPHQKECIPYLENLLASYNERVLEAAISALGQLNGVEAILNNLRLIKHSSAFIRLSMAQCLGTLDSSNARRALIQLSSDNNIDVRNWATFGLGTQCDNNTKKIRAALFARLDDADEETRNEAILGLARRKIRDVIPHLVRELKFQPCNPSPLALEAAHELLASEFLAPLRVIKEEYGDPCGSVSDTIAAIESITLE